METILRGLLGIEDGKRIYHISQQEVTETDYQYGAIMTAVLFAPDQLVETLGPTWNMVHDPLFSRLEDVFIQHKTAQFGGDATQGVLRQLPDGTFGGNFSSLSQYADIIGEGRHFMRVLHSLAIIQAASELWPDRSFRLNPKNLDTPGLELTGPYQPSIIKALRLALDHEGVSVADAATDDGVVELASEWVPDFRTYGVLAPKEKEEVLALAAKDDFISPAGMAKWSDERLWQFIRTYSPNWFTRAGLPNLKAKTLFNLFRVGLTRLIEEYAEVANVRETVLLYDTNTLYDPAIHTDPNVHTVDMEVENLDRALDYRAQIQVLAARVIEALGLKLGEIIPTGEITSIERENLLKIVFSYRWPDQKPAIAAAVFAYLVGIQAQGQPAAQRLQTQLAQLKAAGREHLEGLKSGTLLPVTRATDGTVEVDYSRRTDGECQDLVTQRALAAGSITEQLHMKYHELEKLKDKLVASDTTTIEDLSLVNYAMAVLKPALESDTELTEDAAAELLARVEEAIPTVITEVPVYEGYLPADNPANR